MATVQNRYNLIDRGSEAVLDHCEAQGIGVIPWFPLAAGNLAKPGTTMDRIVRKASATPSQIALAWVLKRSPVMPPTVAFRPWIELPLPAAACPTHPIAPSKARPDVHSGSVRV